MICCVMSSSNTDDKHCETQPIEMTNLVDTDKDCQLFSDRLWRSADHIFRRALRHRYIDMLAKGDINARSIAVAHSRYKDALDQIGYIGEFFQILLGYLEKDEINQLGDYFGKFKSRFDANLVKFEKLFGKIDENFARTPMSMVMYNYKTHLLYNVKQGLLPGLVSILPLFEVLPKVSLHLKSLPNYVNSDLAVMLGFEEVFTKDIALFIKNKIDKLSANISDEQANNLIDIFKRGVALEYLCDQDEFDMVNLYFLI